MSGQENRNFNQYQGGDRRVASQSTGQGPGWDLYQHHSARDRENAAREYAQQQRSQEAGPSSSERRLHQARTLDELLLQGQDQPHEMRDRQDLEQSANRLVGLSQRRDHLLMELEAREKYQSHPSWIPGEPFETWRHRLASEKLASEVYRQQDATRSVGEAQYPAQASESGQPRAREACNDAGEGPSMLHDARAEAGPSNRTNHEKGSWAAVLEPGLWNHTKAFWDNGQQDWSSEIATKKVINETNRYEFQEMQNLKIPGHYLQHRDEDKKIDKYAYIPIKVNNSWRKAFDDTLTAGQIKEMANRISVNQRYQGWSRVKHIQIPDTEIRSPGQTVHAIERSEGNSINYYNEHFKGRNDIQESSFKNLISQVRNVAQGYTRISEAPKGEVKQRVQTPIIWEVAPDQGSSSRT